MEKIDAFEWMLIGLLAVVFITGVFVAIQRHEDKLAIRQTYTESQDMRM